MQAMTSFKPLHYASGYSLDLYCDQPNQGEATKHSWFETYRETFVGETFADCARQAKKTGWKIHRKTRTATCPYCAGKFASINNAQP